MSNRVLAYRFIRPRAGAPEQDPAPDPTGVDPPESDGSSAAAPSRKLSAVLLNLFTGGAQTDRTIRRRRSPGPGSVPAESGDGCRGVGDDLASSLGSRGFLTKTGEDLCSIRRRRHRSSGPDSG